MTFLVNGEVVTEEKALQVWVAYETLNSGISQREAIKIFDRALTEEDARDDLVAAGVEIIGVEIQ